MQPHNRLGSDPLSPRVRLLAASRPTIEVNSLSELFALGGKLTGVAVQGVSIPPGSVDWDAAEVSGLTLLGVVFEDPADEEAARRGGALIFPAFPGRPYDAYRTRLYDRDELARPLSGVTPGTTRDASIYEHYQRCGRDHPDVVESLAQRVHDHAIDDALSELLEQVDRPIVGVMGGHGLLRSDAGFGQTAEMARGIARGGFVVATGGGPGAMEAANLGGLAAELGAPELRSLVRQLAKVPHWSDPDWAAVADKVRDQIAPTSISLGLPTWFYGHEPTNHFATHIAKYFSNSVREDRLLALANGGVVFTPGGPGTIQEVFQDAAQNIYQTYGPPAPMVFLGAQIWAESGVVPLIERLAEQKEQRVSILVTDDIDEVVAALRTHQG